MQHRCSDSLLPGKVEGSERECTHETESTSLWVPKTASKPSTWSFVGAGRNQGSLAFEVDTTLVPIKLVEFKVGIVVVEIQHTAPNAGARHVERAPGDLLD